MKQTLRFMVYYTVPAIAMAVVFWFGSLSAQDIENLNIGEKVLSFSMTLFIFMLFNLFVLVLFGECCFSTVKEYAHEVYSKNYYGMAYIKWYTDRHGRKLFTSGAKHYQCIFRKKKIKTIDLRDKVFIIKNDKLVILNEK